MENEKKELIRAAIKARTMAYAPYSGYKVGAALLCEDGTVFSGCNVENASYPATNCAERTAIFKAVSEGYRKFKMIAVTGGSGEEPQGYAYPCGICRQVMSEFCKKQFVVLVAQSEDDYKEFTLEQLLPASFEL